MAPSSQTPQSTGQECTQATGRPQSPHLQGIPRELAKGLGDAGLLTTDRQQPEAPLGRRGPWA